MITLSGFYCSSYVTKNSKLGNFCTFLISELNLNSGRKNSSGIHYLVRGQRRYPERRLQLVVGGRGQVLELPGLRRVRQRRVQVIEPT